LQTLYDRGYVVGKSIEVTNFGEHVIEVLNEYCPRILSEELTRKFEEEMELVSEGKKKREKIIEEAEVILKDLLEDFKKNEDKIGKGLSKAYIAFKDKQRHVGKCPQCGKDLIVIRSRRTGKRFVGCSGYKDGCRFSTPLPQAGMITTTDKTCKECEYPVIMVKFKGKRPFFSCINMKCPTKEKYKKSKEAKEKKKIDKKLPKSKEKERPKG
jgi:DNA topoisomerase-1